jgi:hypothetical protein
MTRTEISKRVFNGNLSGNILADALRALNEAGYATVTKEPTAGAPSERWFSSGAVRI